MDPIRRIPWRLPVGVECMKRLRCVIADDEPIARYLLRSVLESHPDIEVVAEAGDVGSAVDQLEESNPDVVFLDIRMPDGTGFDVLKRLGLRIPEVVLVTAYEEFALQAFRENVVDYLLKPVESDRVAAALERVRQRLRRKSPIGGSRSDVPQDVPQDFPVSWERSSGLSHLAWIASEGNYCRLETFDGQNILVRRTLTAWSRHLPFPPFLKLGRCLIVNTLCLVRAEFGSKGGVVFFEGGRQLLLGKKAADRLRCFVSSTDSTRTEG